VSVYINKSGMLIGTFQVVVRERDGFEDGDWLEPIYMCEGIQSFDNANKLGEAFVDGMYHERANNQVNHNG